MNGRGKAVSQADAGDTNMTKVIGGRLTQSGTTETLNQVRQKGEPRVEDANRGEPPETTKADFVVKVPNKFTIA
jgi:hypothetical protein